MRSVTSSRFIAFIIPASAASGSRFMSLLLSEFEADDVGRGPRRNVPRCGDPRPDRSRLRGAVRRAAFYPLRAVDEEIHQVVANAVVLGVVVNVVAGGAARAGVFGRLRGARPRAVGDHDDVFRRAEGPPHRRGWY